MTALDATGLRAIEELAEATRDSGRHLVLCGARHQPADLMARAHARHREPVVQTNRAAADGTA